MNEKPYHIIASFLLILALIGLLSFVLSPAPTTMRIIAASVSSVVCVVLAILLYIFGKGDGRGD